MKQNALEGSRVRFALCFAVVELLIFSLFLGGAVAFLCPARYRHEARLYASSFSLSPALVLAMVRAESGGDPNAVSDEGAIGLLQLMPATFEEARQGLSLAPDASPLDPSANLLCGSWYFSSLLEEFRHIDVALAAYNAGPTRVRQWLRDPALSKDGEHLISVPYPETEAYVRRVLILEELFQFVI